MTLPAASEIDPANFATFDDEWAKARMELAREGVARSRAAAELVQKASVALATVYTALLGLAFSVAERPLNTNALVPAIFIGLGIVCPVVYSGFVTATQTTSTWEPKQVRAPRRWEQVNAFTDEVNRLVSTRSWWLRAGITATAVGLVLIPIPFLTTSSPPPAVEIPAPRAVTSAPEATLEAIRYEAEVAEVTRRRAAEQRAEPISGWWGLALLAVGSACVLTVASVFPRSAASRRA